MDNTFKYFLELNSETETKKNLEGVRLVHGNSTICCLRK